MALKKLQNYVPVVQKNKQDAGGVGVAKEDQIELTATTTDPSTNLSAGRIYYYTGGTIKHYNGSAWKSLVNSDDGRLTTTGRQLTVTDVTESTTLTTEDSNEIIFCNCTGADNSMYLTLPSAAEGGIIYRIVNISADAACGGLRICPHQSAGISDWIAGSTGSYRSLDAQYDGITLVSGGGTNTNWLRLNHIA